CFVFFFFPAEDGIRAFHVTGVQTCALPISVEGIRRHLRRRPRHSQHLRPHLPCTAVRTRRLRHRQRRGDRRGVAPVALHHAFARSEERRVGKGGASRAQHWSSARNSKTMA